METKFQGGLDLPKKYSNEIRNEAISLAKEGITDAEISRTLGVSTKFVYNLRKQHGLALSPGKKQYDVEQLNQVIDLIREGYPIGQISELTGVNNNRIRKLHTEEIREGNPLPDIKRGISRRQKYSDEDVIELAYQNPGYGLKRFIEKLGISETFALNLFLEYKEWTNGEEDLIALLQDSTHGQMITRQDYFKITGDTSVPKGAGISNSRKSKLDRKGERGGFLRDVFLPPQDFNWGNVRRRTGRSSNQLEDVHDPVIFWIQNRVLEKGYLNSIEDKDQFVAETGAGATKFNKWMKRAGLEFDKKSQRWTKR